MKNSIDSYFTGSLTVQTKDEHLTELKALIDKEIIFNNKLSITKSYSEAQIFSNEISIEKFPKGQFNNDLIFNNGYKELIKKISKRNSRIQYKTY